MMQAVRIATAGLLAYGAWRMYQQSQADMAAQDATNWSDTGGDILTTADGVLTDTGQTAADCDGTATVAHVATDLLIASGDSHNVYLNVADGWAASGDAGARIYGTVSLLWAKMA